MIGESPTQRSLNAAARLQFLWCLFSNGDNADKIAEVCKAPLGSDISSFMRFVMKAAAECSTINQVKLLVRSALKPTDEDPTNPVSMQIADGVGSAASYATLFAFTLLCLGFIPSFSISRYLMACAIETCEVEIFSYEAYQDSSSSNEMYNLYAEALKVPGRMPRYFGDPPAFCVSMDME